MPGTRSPDAEVLRNVYALLSTYLAGLRETRGAAHSEDVRALLDALTDKALDAERKVLDATRRASGQVRAEGY